MKTNPLFIFLKQANPSLSLPVVFHPGKNIRNAYLLLDMNQNSSKHPSTLPNLTLVDRHIRIDKLTKLLNETQCRNPYSSNFCPAHYTERYIDPKSNDQIVLHVYFNIKGHILKTSCKFENNNKPIPLTRQQLANAAQSAAPASQIIEEINATRYKHVADKTEKAKITEKIEYIYEMLDRGTHQNVKRTLREILPIIEQNNLFTSGEITAQTKFLTRLAENISQTASNVSSTRNSFNLFGTAENQQDAQPALGNQQSKVKPEQQSENSNKTPKQRQKHHLQTTLSQQLNELSKKCRSWHEEETSIMHYHDEYRYLIGEFYSLQYNDKKLTSSQKKNLKNIRSILNKYRMPASQIFDFTKSGEIEKLNSVANYLSTDPEAILFSAIVSLSTCFFRHIPDENLAKVLEYFLTCDKFANCKKLIHLMSINTTAHGLMSIKHLLLITGYHKSFLKLADLLPNQLLTIFRNKFDALQLMTQTGNFQLIEQYLDVMGATHPFNQYTFVSHEELGCHLTHLSTGKVLAKDGHRKRFTKISKKVIEVINSPHMAKKVLLYTPPSNTTLLFNIYKNNLITEIIAPNTTQSPQSTEKIKRFCKKYISATKDDCHSFLHAILCLTQSSAADTKLEPFQQSPMLQSCATIESNQIMYDLEMVRLKMRGIDLNALPPLFINYYWEPEDRSLKK